MDFNRGEKIYINTENLKINPSEIFTEKEIKELSHTKVIHFYREHAETEKQDLLQYYKNEIKIFNTVCFRKINGNFSVGDIEDYLDRDLPNSLQEGFKIPNRRESLFCVVIA